MTLKFTEHYWAVRSTLALIVDASVAETNLLSIK